MECKEIYEMSVKYLEKELSYKQKYDFIFHIDKCINCQKTFAIINAGYDTSIETVNIPIDLVQPVKESINFQQYSGQYKFKTKRNKLVIVLIAAALCISATVAAKPILKTLDELLNTAVLYNNSISEYPSKNINAEEKLSIKNTLTDVKKLYEKYSNRIQDIIRDMNTGEVRTLSFEGESEDFFVNVGKGEVSKSIFYGSKTHSGGFIASDISAETMSGIVKKSIQELIENQYFIPVIKDLPPGYEIDSISTTANEELVESVYYKSVNGSYLSITLTENRVITDDSPQKSLESVNGMQAVYIERDIEGSKLGQLIIYLGDDKRQRVVMLSSKIDETINKEKLLALACDMEFYNEDKNDSKNQIYFKNVSGPRLEGYLNDFFQKVQQGQQDITIPITSEINLRRSQRSGKINTYYIDYNGSEYKTIQPYCNYPLILNRNIYEKASLQSTTIVGFGYNADKEISYNLELKDQSEERDISNILPKIRVNARPIKYTMQQYPILDIMINEKVTIPYSRFIDEKLIFDKNNHPYIVSDYMINYEKSGKYFRTIYNIDGRYVQYNITIHEAALGNMDEYEFINGLEFVK